jgi:hypothetical protein
MVVPAVLAGILAGALLLAATLRSLVPGSGWLRSTVLGRATTIDVSQPTVVQRIQQLQRLETVSYTMDKVVEGRKESKVFPDFLAGDRILLLVHGVAVAGIDFARLQPGDVVLSEHGVRVHLPDPEVFITSLDNTKTRVYSRTTGLLVPVDPNLESAVRAEAERQLREAALEGGILESARQNAGATVTAMLKGLGFEHIEVQ